MQPQVSAINETYSICHNQLLGKGSTGNVYLGYHNHNTTHKVAIKEIDLSTINNEVTQYLLSCQIAALSNLGKLQNTAHQNIVKLIEIIINQNTMFLVMELLEGGTLSDYIKRHPNGLPEEEAMIIIHQILQAYQRIKDKQIIHRDLKPDNVLFKRPPEESKQIAIIDFGYCTMEEVPNRPKVFYNVGSPKYMSPEAYKQNRYSQKSDIWAIGVMLYEMLVGSTCDKGLTMQDYLQMMEKNGVPLPQKLNDFHQYLLRNMLNFNHSKRFGCQHALTELNRNSNGTNRHTAKAQIPPDFQQFSNKNAALVKQNSLVHLRSSINNADIMALRGGRNQMVFHSLMFPGQPLVRMSRNSVHEQSMRSQGRIPEPNQNVQAENKSARMISFHFPQNNKPQIAQQENYQKLERIENVNLTSVRSIVHKKIQEQTPDLTKHNTLPQKISPHQRSREVQQQQKPNNFIPNGGQHLIFGINPQQISKPQIKSTNIIMNSSPKQQNQGAIQRNFQSKEIFNNTITPRMPQQQLPANLQMSVFHPHNQQVPQPNQQLQIKIPQTPNQIQQIFQSSFQQAQQTEKGMPKPDFKKAISKGPLIINAGQQMIPEQQNYRPRVPQELQSRYPVFPQDLTVTRIPTQQRFVNPQDQQKQLPFRNLADTIHPQQLQRRPELMTDRLIQPFPQHVSQRRQLPPYMRMAQEPYRLGQMRNSVPQTQMFRPLVMQ